MVASSKFPIDYAAAYGSTRFDRPPKGVPPVPVRTFAGTPPDAFQPQVPGFASQFNAVDSMVCTLH